MTTPAFNSNQDLSIAYLGVVKDGANDTQLTYYFDVNDLDGPKPGIRRVQYSTRTEQAYCEGCKETSCRHAAHVWTSLRDEVGFKNLKLENPLNG